jgi:adenylate cyclase class 2
MARFEVEKKFRIGDVDGCLREVQRCFDGQLQTTVTQSDRYLAHPVRDFAKTDEALRIRVVTAAGKPGQVRVTYKGPRKLDGSASRDVKTRREIEAGFPAGEESAEQLDRVFQALGFRPVLTVTKTRQRIAARVEDWPVEFALDQVDGLGSFLEIEIVTEPQQVAAAEQVLGRISGQLGLSGAITTSYLDMLLVQQHISRPAGLPSGGKAAEADPREAS